MKNAIPVVISAMNYCYVVQGRPVKIGKLDGVFAVTPNGSYFGGIFVLTHIASGFAVPGSSADSVKEVVKRGSAAILKEGKAEYERKVQQAIDEHGAKVAAVYGSMK